MSQSKNDVGEEEAMVRFSSGCLSTSVYESNYKVRQDQRAIVVTVRAARKAWKKGKYSDVDINKTYLEYMISVLTHALWTGPLSDEELVWISHQSGGCQGSNQDGYFISYTDRIFRFRDMAEYQNAHWQITQVKEGYYDPWNKEED